MRRDDSGRFTQEFERREFIESVRRGGAVGTSDVAETVGCAYETAYKALERLHDEGHVEKKPAPVGNGYLWAIAAKTATSGGDDVETPIETTPDPCPNDAHPTNAGGRTGGSGSKDEDHHETGGDILEDSNEERAEALRQSLRNYMADRPPRTPHASEGLLDVFFLLRERGTMKTGELKDAIYPAYREHYGNKRTMWESLARYLEDVPGIEKGGYGKWTYAGDDAVRNAVEGGLPSTGGMYDPTKEDL